MSRRPADPIARLAKLEAARAAIDDTETFNARDMATIAWRNMREIVAADQDFPVAVRGSEGVPFVFNGAAVLDYMIAKARSVQADRERRTDRATFLAGLGAQAGPSPSGNSKGSGSAARELMEDAKALSALIDVQAKLRAEKVAQGKLIDRAETEDFLWRWLSGLQSSVLAIEGRIDKAGKIEPDIRTAVKDELAAALVEMRTELEKRIEAWNARAG